MAVGVVSIKKTAGPAQLSYAGHNSYRGPTVIGAGTLKLTGVGSVSDTGVVSLTGSTSVFDIPKHHGEDLDDRLVGRSFRLSGSSRCKRSDDGWQRR